MLVGAEPIFRQPAKESQVAFAHQALSGLRSLFYLDNHPELLIGQGGQGFRLVPPVTR
jgi:hypothetical protein